MAQLAAFLLTSDDDFRRDFGRLVRSGSVPIGIVEDARRPEQMEPDLAFVDIRPTPPAASAPSSGFGRASAAVDLRDRARRPTPT